MAFNTGSYNPYNSFQAPYRAYNPSATAYNPASNLRTPNSYYTNWGSPTAPTTGYSQPSAYGTYNTANRFQTPSYNSGTQNRYSYPTTGYGTQYQNMGNRYAATRPYFEEPPQIIYMQQAPAAPKKSVWDWKKFTFNAVSIAAGLGLAGIFCVKILPKAIVTEFMEQAPRRALEKRASTGGKSFVDWIRDLFKTQAIQLSKDPEISTALARTAQNTLDKALNPQTVIKLQGMVDQTLSKEFLTQQIAKLGTGDGAPIQGLTDKLIASIKAALMRDLVGDPVFMKNLGDGAVEAIQQGIQEKGGTVLKYFMGPVKR